jgi:hypothetical protein
MRDIHFGGVTASPEWGRWRHRRTAATISSTPMTTSTPPEPSDASLSELTSAASERLSTTAPTAASPTIQPATNARLFAFPRAVNSMRITATIGSGLTRMPTASPSTSPNASSTIAAP